ncbi:hypothetical protein DFAR_2910003 [Desulfarculales bacterium]
MLLVGDKRRKIYLFAFINDMNRLVALAELYLSEGLPLIYRPCARPCSHWTTTQALPRQRPSLPLPPSGRDHRRPGQCLGPPPPYVPQGRGKIEKLFRTVRFQFLPSFKGDTLRDINEALECWIRDVYHQRKHLGTG